MTNEEQICEINDTVLCYHFDKLYPAKCLNIAPSENGHSLYFIHYRGWSKKWDEWVPLSRLVKFNPENTTMLTTSSAVDNRAKKSHKSSKSSVPGVTSSLITSNVDQQKLTHFDPIENFVLDRSLHRALQQDKTYVTTTLINLTTVDEVTNEFASNNATTVHNILLRYLDEIGLLVEPSMRNKMTELEPLPGALSSTNDLSLIHDDTDEMAINTKSNQKNNSNAPIFGPTTKTLMRMASIHHHHPSILSLKSSRKRPSRKIKNFTGFNLSENYEQEDIKIHTLTPSATPKSKHSSKKESSKTNSRSNFPIKRYIDIETYKTVRDGLETFVSYFNQYLFQYLLYEEEVPLYDILKEKYGESFLPSGIFGTTYLLRLLYKLQELLKLSADSVPSKVLYRYSLIYKDLNEWLDKNMAIFIGKSILASDPETFS